MDIKNCREIRQQADSALSSASYSPRKLAMLYGGVLMGFSLLLTVINFILARQIDSTGGLSGLGMRTTLTTIQSMLQFASTVLMPFWEIGFLAAAVGMVRNQKTEPGTLLQGFSRFGSVLWLLVLQSVLLGAIGVLCFNISMGIYMLTPLSSSLIEALGPVMETANATGQIPMDDATMSMVLGKMVPGLVIFLVLYLLIAIPLLYRFRMARYLVMDTPRMGGMTALFCSARMMKKNCINLFKVDLSFWWYYVLQTLFSTLCYGDLILKMVGIKLPLPPEAAYFLFYVLYAVLQFLLVTYAKAKLETTYAVVYDRLRFNLEQSRQQIVPPQQQ